MTALAPLPATIPAAADSGEAAPPSGSAGAAAQNPAGAPASGARSASFPELLQGFLKDGAGQKKGTEKKDDASFPALAGVGLPPSALPPPVPEDLSAWMGIRPASPAPVAAEAAGATPASEDGPVSEGSTRARIPGNHADSSRLSAGPPAAPVPAAGAAPVAELEVPTAAPELPVASDRSAAAAVRIERPPEIRTAPAPAAEFLPESAPAPRATASAAAPHPPTAPPLPDPPVAPAREAEPAARVPERRPPTLAAAVPSPDEPSRPRTTLRQASRMIRDLGSRPDEGETSGGVKSVSLESTPPAPASEDRPAGLAFGARLTPLAPKPAEAPRPSGKGGTPPALPLASPERPPEAPAVLPDPRASRRPAAGKGAAEPAPSAGDPPPAGTGLADSRPATTVPVAEAARPGSRPAEPGPAASPAPCQPAAPAPPAAAPAAAHEIRLQVAGEERRVEVRLTERGGEVQVAVRTPDSRLAGALREDLPALSARLEQTGFRTETWLAAGTTAGHHGPAAAETRFSGATPDGQQPGGQSGRQQPQDSPGREPSPDAEPGGESSPEEFSWLLSSQR